MNTPYALQQRQVANIFAKAVKSVSADIVEMVVHGVTASNRAATVRAAQLELIRAFAKAEVSARVEPLLVRAAAKGARLSKGGAVSAIDVLAFQRQAEFYAENFVERIVDAAVSRNLGKDSAALAKLVKRLTSDNDVYWKSVANGAVSQSYHLGVLKGAERTGVRWAYYDATLDDRTSVMCKRLNGRRVNVTKALETLEEMAGMDESELARHYVPFSLINDPKITVTALRKTGVLVPPFHPHCRTIIRFV